MRFNFSSPEYLSSHKRRKNRVSPVSRASPAHMNSPYWGGGGGVGVHIHIFAFCTTNFF